MISILEVIRGDYLRLLFFHACQNWNLLLVFPAKQRRSVAIVTGVTTRLPHQHTPLFLDFAMAWVQAWSVLDTR